MPPPMMMASARASRRHPRTTALTAASRLRQGRQLGERDRLHRRAQPVIADLLGRYATRLRHQLGDRETAEPALARAHAAAAGRTSAGWDRSQPSATASTNVASAVTSSQRQTMVSPRGRGTAGRAGYSVSRKARPRSASSASAAAERRHAVALRGGVDARRACMRQLERGDTAADNGGSGAARSRHRRPRSRCRRPTLRPSDRPPATAELQRRPSDARQPADIREIDVGHHALVQQQQLGRRSSRGRRQAIGHAREPSSPAAASASRR